jgi:hypothetical protein
MASFAPPALGAELNNEKLCELLVMSQFEFSSLRFL